MLRITGIGFTVTVTVSLAEQPVALVPVTINVCVMVSVKYGFEIPGLLTEPVGVYWLVCALLLVIN